ncbi:MAG TPA: ATP-binding protein, partial [Thermoanaerobaculia bacterium]|nr:ATP-binding protein [Thermoanaerobaculia bacterium]
IAAARDGEELRIEIEDDGSGIPEEVLAHIYEPFVTTKEGSGGVGLGLAISRGIVDRHGGRIEVDSQVGRGTRFTITLPVEKVSQPALSRAE